MSCELYLKKTVKKDPQKSGVVVLMSTKQISEEKYYKNKEDIFIIIRWSVHKDKIIIVNIYEPNNCIKIHDTKTDQTGRRKRQMHNTTLNNCQNNQEIS